MAIRSDLTESASKSGRGLPQSKTLARVVERLFVIEGWARIEKGRRG